MLSAPCSASENVAYTGDLHVDSTKPPVCELHVWQVRGSTAELYL